MPHPDDYLEIKKDQLAGSSKVNSPLKAAGGPSQKWEAEDYYNNKHRLRSYQSPKRVRTDFATDREGRYLPRPDFPRKDPGCLINDAHMVCAGTLLRSAWIPYRGCVCVCVCVCERCVRCMCCVCACVACVRALRCVRAASAVCVCVRALRALRARGIRCGCACVRAASVVCVCVCGTAKFGTTKGCQNMPGSSKVCGHFSWCHFPCARGVCSTGTMAATCQKPPGTTAANQRPIRNNTEIRSAIHSRYLLHHNLGKLYHTFQWYLTIGAKFSPHQFSPFQILRVQNRPHAIPNPMGGQPTHRSMSGRFLPYKANMYPCPEAPIGILVQP